MFQLSTKKSLITLSLGLIFTAGILFLLKGGEISGLALNEEDLTPTQVVKIADLSKINWEIEVVEESDLPKS